MSPGEKTSIPSSVPPAAAAVKPNAWHWTYGEGWDVHVLLTAALILDRDALEITANIHAADLVAEDAVREAVANGVCHDAVRLALIRAARSALEVIGGGQDLTRAHHLLRSAETLMVRAMAGEPAERRRGYILGFVEGIDSLCNGPESFVCDVVRNLEDSAEDPRSTLAFHASAAVRSAYGCTRELPGEYDRPERAARVFFEAFVDELERVRTGRPA